MIKKFIVYYKPHLKLFIADLVCALFVAAINLVFPIALSSVLKNYHDNITIILLVGLGLLVLFVIRFFLEYFISYYGHLVGIRIESDMRHDLYKKFQEIDYQFYDDKKTGELMANLTTHLFDVSEMSHHAPEDIFISGIMLIGSFIILILINWQLTLIVFLCLAMLIAYSIWRRLSLAKSFREQRTAQAELYSEVESSLNGIRLTKAFDNEDIEMAKFDVFNGDYKIARSHTFKAMGLFASGNNFFIGLANLSILVFGCIFLLTDDKFLIEDLTSYFLYINFLIAPINRLVNSIQQIENGLSGIERFYQIMEIEPKIVSPDNALKGHKFQGDIKFSNVYFEYGKDKSSQILSNFNLEIKAGESIALVGETGVGKTTISKLIPRFYDVSKGAILVDDINIKTYDLDELRNSIGHVQQDVFIFYGSFRDNISYGNPDATEEELIDASKKARIYDLIKSSPDGFDTLLGDKGVKLSGGEKQRIAIARLFLKNPEILILDEATSSLDNITEKLIQESLDILSKGKTTITIAHRLSTTKNADKIVVLGKDGIIENGTHDELLKQDGYYKHLYDASVTI